MVPVDYPVALQERLGSAGTAALAEVLASVQDATVTLAKQSFERRLGDECGKLRLEVSTLGSALRSEMNHMRAELRSEMKQMRAELGSEMNQMRTDLRADFKVAFADLRSDLLKWSFVFWVGQVAAIVGFVALLR
jgi:hypothetical protein